MASSQAEEVNAVERSTIQTRCHFNTEKALTMYIGKQAYPLLTMYTGKQTYSRLTIYTGKQAYPTLPCTLGNKHIPT